MTGAGNTNAAYLHEPVGDYAGTPTDSDYKTPGRDATLTELSFANAVQRMYGFADAEAVESVATTFEGAIGVDFVLGNGWWLNHVFGGPPTDGGEASSPYSYTWNMGTGQVQSSRWYVGVDYFSGTAERELKGVVFGSMTITCNIGEPVRCQLTGFYGDEAKNASLTPGSQPQEQETPLIFHGGSMEIPDTSTLAKMQSATLTVNTGARPQRGWQRKPVDAVMGAVETSLDVSKISTGTSQLDLAYGTSTAPSTSDIDGASAATLSFTTPGATGMTFNLTNVKPDNYDWQGIGDPNADVTEDISFTVDNVEAVAESSSSTAR